MQKYPEGLNTCTCRNLSFSRWQYRNCFETKIIKLQRHFRRRVNVKWRGLADRAIIGDDFYYTDWKEVRKMLQRLYPCSQTCGRKRQAGLFVDQALDCRCCGGMIIQPSRHSGRIANGPKKTYKEMDEEEIVGSKILLDILLVWILSFFAPFTPYPITPGELRLLQIHQCACSEASTTTTSSNTADSSFMPFTPPRLAPQSWCTRDQGIILSSVHQHDGDIPLKFVRPWKTDMLLELLSGKDSA